MFDVQAVQQIPEARKLDWAAASLNHLHGSGELQAFYYEEEKQPPSDIVLPQQLIRYIEYALTPWSKTMAALCIVAPSLAQSHAIHVHHWSKLERLRTSLAKPASSDLRATSRSEVSNQLNATNSLDEMSQIAQELMNGAFVDVTDKITTLKVGADVGKPRDFHIHAGVLCRTSEFMKTRLKPEWRLEDNTIQLPHINPVSFAMYTDWLYTKSLAPNGKRLNKQSKWTAMPEDWLILAEAYILGEEFLDHAFKDAIADLMVYIATRRPVASRSALRDLMPMDRVVQIVFDGTPETSPSRGLLIGGSSGMAKSS
ncbi:Putative BTB/POZ domain-containing protein [Septoria linicola]|uniref:BTB/POZ domain-containing protein n=1 Tax=Septoria linicola TaxID=215465 RepID=A0A9Q9B1F5_9PEZI|nr:putative BTB/POZ domain-containing protein [Septoria linicola]USW59209.1 Putative BTB/POZ domain-containing protein [Septoria linicola]